ncbi:MAG: radical SAM protein, partial [Deltaproteobacteria bacterium]|nr:radical SAM protein [Deltaproteobacteria bacterium]
HGERLDPQIIVRFTRNFDSVVIWGAGNLGTAVGSKLLELGVPVSCYWDIQAEIIKTCNGLGVTPPFTGYLRKETTLVLFCIGNVAIGPNVFRQLAENGWKHVVHGNDLLQGLLCPLSNERPPDTKICNSLDICSVCSCERLHNIVRANAARKLGISLGETLSFDRVHFIVNNICNLKCKHCFVYINSYPKEYKQNVSIGQILQDIDVVMRAVHSFGVVNIFGGEPFLHKDLDRIVSRVLSHDNMGAVIVNSNGTVRIENSQLASMADERVRLAFSNYLEVIDERKKALFFRNIETAKSSGVNTKYQNTLPTWNISSTLENKRDSIETTIQKKSACGVRFLYVFDGRLFPCAFALSIHDLRVADYKTDYVLLDPNKSPEEIRDGIRELISRLHYRACGHCDAFGSPALTSQAAEQGFDSRYALPEE